VKPHPKRGVQRGACARRVVPERDIFFSFYRLCEREVMTSRRSFLFWWVSITLKLNPICYSTPFCVLLIFGVYHSGHADAS
jgi:hypothetical protein